MKSLTDIEYAAMVKNASPKSKSYMTVTLAFVTGGTICAFGEGLARLYLYMGVEKDTAYTAVSITLVFISALLTGLNVYDNIARYGGAGTLVPITGFANAVASPALEFKTEGFILGVGAKLFAISGPVIVYSIVSGIVYGVILYLFKLY